MDISVERERRVSETIGIIRGIEAEKGVCREALDDIKSVLLELAENPDLFPLEDFPVNPEEDGNGVIYRLSEDDDHRFALYASIAMPGKGVHPHNHTTWAVIVGVHGDEHNIFYERTDDLSRDGKGALAVSGEETVRHGTGVTLMPEDIHSIHVTGDIQTVHLHMYGLALEQLHERVMYNQREGTYKVFPATRNIKPV